MLRACALVAAASAAAASASAERRALLPSQDGVNASTDTAPGPAYAAKLPPIYYINLEANPDRRAHMEGVLQDLPTSAVHRVNAVTLDDIEHGVKSGHYKLGDGLSVLKPNSTLAAPHIWGAYKVSEFACTASHVRAIKQAYKDGQQLALIIEDDVSFEHFSHWDATMQDLAVSAPTDWEVLQLHTNNPAFYLEPVSYTHLTLPTICSV